MKNLIIIAFVFFALAACQEKVGVNQLTKAEVKEGWQLLFDGKTTDGWKGYCKGNVPGAWTVTEEGTLHIAGSGKGEAGAHDGGDIITREKYGNFELSLEWKVSEGGNSGIFYLSQEICGTDSLPGDPIWKSSPEMQILDNAKHPDAKLGKEGNRQAGSLYDLIPAKPQNAKPAGEWNHIKITVYKGTIIHWMNGENVLEYHLWTDDWKTMCMNSKFAEFLNFVNPASEGHIGLQDHGDDIWFRNIKIRKL
ncbi:MAG: DUF1080 domain-containing protein [Salinivirgaceae bacterium]|jgi:hypothetical protein